MLNGAITNFGRVVSRDERGVVKVESGPFASRRPQSKRSRRRANRRPYTIVEDPEPPRSDVRRADRPSLAQVIAVVALYVALLILSTIFGGK